MANYNWSDLAKSVLPGMQTAFMGGFKEIEQGWEGLATKFTAAQKKETYPWIADHGDAREWDTERQPTAGAENYYEITSKDYEVSWRVFRDALRYEKYGQMKMQAYGRGRRLGMYVNELVMSLFANAQTTATYTGDGATYVVANDHSEGESGTQDNLLAGALSDTTLTSARQAMYKFKDARGKRLGFVGDTIMVPIELEKTALSLVNSERLVGSMDNDTNVHRGAYRVIVNPFMTDADDWILLCTSGLVMPAAWQEKQAPTPVEIINDQLKAAKYVDYGSDMTGRAFLTDWRYMVYMAN